MSKEAIKSYLAEVEKIRHFSGMDNESSIQNAFYNLLNVYAKQKGLLLIAELTDRANKKTVRMGLCETL